MTTFTPTPCYPAGPGCQPRSFEARGTVRTRCNVEKKKTRSVRSAAEQRSFATLPGRYDFARITEARSRIPIMSGHARLLATGETAERRQSREEWSKKIDSEGLRKLLIIISLISVIYRCCCFNVSRHLIVMINNTVSNSNFSIRHQVEI